MHSLVRYCKSRYHLVLTDLSLELYLELQFYTILGRVLLPSVLGRIWCLNIMIKATKETNVKMQMLCCWIKAKIGINSTKQLRVIIRCKRNTIPQIQYNKIILFILSKLSSFWTQSGMNFWKVIFITEIMIIIHL